MNDNNDGTHVITITQPDGRQPITTTIKDGKPGPQGERGVNGLNANAVETLVVADIYRYDKVEKVENFYYFTDRQLTKFLYTNISYHPNKINWQHWWSDIKSTDDITIDVPLKSLGGASKLNSDYVTCIDKDGRIYAITNANDSGGYPDNPGTFKTIFYNYNIRGPVVPMDAPSRDEYDAVWKFLRAVNPSDPENAKNRPGYLYTITRMTSRKGKTSVFVTSKHLRNTIYY